MLRDRLLAAFAKGRQELDWTAIALESKEDAGLAASPEPLPVSDKIVAG
jgi:hypothetical protein